MAKKTGNLMVLGAERRAKVMALLNERNDWIGIEAVSERVGLDLSAARGLVYAMTNSGLIQSRRFGKKTLYALKGKVPGATDGEAIVKRKYARRDNGSVRLDKDVELVVGGMLVIVGRNPETGRLRITLEETP